MSANPIEIGFYRPFFGLGINGMPCVAKSISFRVVIIGLNGQTVFERTYTAQEADFSVSCSNSNCDSIKIRMSFRIDISISSGYQFIIFITNGVFFGKSISPMQMIYGRFNFDSPSGVLLNLTLYENTGNPGLNQAIVEAMNNGTLKLIHLVVAQGTTTPLAEGEFTYDIEQVRVQVVAPQPYTPYTAYVINVTGLSSVTTGFTSSSTLFQYLILRQSVYDSTCTNVTRTIDYLITMSESYYIQLITGANEIRDYKALASYKIKFEINIFEVTGTII